jgi:DNA-binding FadR family transcriptional regulator
MDGIGSLSADADILEDRPLLRTIRSKRVYEQIAEQLEELIQSRHFKPGHRLPPERELAKQLGVSRPSVREAMIALETAGFIEVRTGDGTYVLELPRGSLRFPWAVGGDPGPGPLEQFEARVLVETELAVRAAQLATPAEIAELEAILERMEVSYREHGTRDDHDGYLFHTALARAGGNGILAGLVKTLWDMRGEAMWTQVRNRVVRKEHIERVLADRRALLDALHARDAAGVRQAMHDIFERARARYFGEEPETSAG